MVRIAPSWSLHELDLVAVGVDEAGEPRYSGVGHPAVGRGDSEPGETSDLGIEIADTQRWDRRRPALWAIAFVEGESPVSVEDHLLPGTVTGPGLDAETPIPLHGASEIGDPDEHGVELEGDRP
jgi:hypothetical protein